MSNGFLTQIKKKHFFNTVGAEPQKFSNVTTQQNKFFLKTAPVLYNLLTAKNEEKPKQCCSFFKLNFRNCSLK